MVGTSPGGPSRTALIVASSFSYATNTIAITRGRAQGTEAHGRRYALDFGNSTMPAFVSERLQEIWLSAVRLAGRAKMRLSRINTLRDGPSGLLLCRLERVSKNAEPH
jgi:hypothetical protein